MGPSPDTTAKKWTTSPDSLAGLGAWVLLAMILALHQDLAAQDRCHLEFRCGGPPGRESEQRQSGASLSPRLSEDFYYYASTPVPSQLPFWVFLKVNTFP